MITPKWIRFELAKSLPKTNVWDIFTVQGSVHLGIVKWHPGWRKYAFFPDETTIWETDCLKDVISFIEEKTRIRK